MCVCVCGCTCVVKDWGVGQARVCICVGGEGGLWIDVCPYTPRLLKRFKSYVPLGIQDPGDKTKVMMLYANQTENDILLQVRTRLPTGVCFWPVVAVS